MIKLSWFAVIALTTALLAQLVTTASAQVPTSHSLTTLREAGRLSSIQWGYKKWCPSCQDVQNIDGSIPGWLEIAKSGQGQAVVVLDACTLPPGLAEANEQLETSIVRLHQRLKLSTAGYEENKPKPPCQADLYRYRAATLASLVERFE